MLRSPLAWIGVVLLVLAGGALLTRPDRALRVATGSAAHDLCSETFVAGLDPDRLYAESLRPRPGFRMIAPWLQWSVDRAQHTVQAGFFGHLESRARWSATSGCRLEFASDAPAPEAPPANAPAEPMTGATIAPSDSEAQPLIAAPPAEPVEPTDPRLKQALDEMFREPPEGPPRWTTSVVVLHRGHIVAERYAKGYGVHTPILGFSMTKSVTNALVGILVQKTRLSVTARAPIAAWDNPVDPRYAITLEQLMRMDSGLDLDETGSGFDPSNQMFYDEPEMAAYAASAGLKAAPGTRWHYSSASTHLVARIVRDAVGGTGPAVQEFARRELFEPLGMQNVTLEMDRTGTPIGAHYMLASARDWARFGWLYAEDGMAGGRRILPDGWVQFSRTPTLDTDYGAGFWSNLGSHPHARARVSAGMPAETLFASGNLGQRIAIIPSLHLVIVRTGHSHGPDYDIAGFVHLVKACAEATAEVPPRATGSS